MAKNKFFTDGLPDEAATILVTMGQNYAMTRKKRRLRMTDIAERIDSTRQTVARMEKGDPSVAMGAWLKYAFVLDLLNGFSEICHPDTDRKGQWLDKESRAHLQRIREKHDRELDF